MNGEQASREKDGGRSTDLKSKWEGGSAGNSETLLCKERKCRSLRGALRARGISSPLNFSGFSLDHHSYLRPESQLINVLAFRALLEKGSFVVIKQTGGGGEEEHTGRTSKAM